MSQFPASDASHVRPKIHHSFFPSQWSTILLLLTLVLATATPLAAADILVDLRVDAKSRDYVNPNAPYGPVSRTIWTIPGPGLIRVISHFSDYLDSTTIDSGITTSNVPGATNAYAWPGRGIASGVDPKAPVKGQPYTKVAVMRVDKRIENLVVTVGPRSQSNPYKPGGYQYSGTTILRVEFIPGDGTDWPGGLFSGLEDSGVHGEAPESAASSFPDAPGGITQPARSGKPLFAVLIRDASAAWFFWGSRYLRYNIIADRADPGYPKPIDSQTWPGLVWTDGIDAAVNMGNGKLCLFRNGQYLRFDIAADRADPGYPKRIDAQTWPGLIWTDGIDAAVNMGNGKLCFFKNGQYLRYDIAADRADQGYPKRIDEQTWPGLIWTDGIDAAVNLGNGKLYFFKNGQYLRYDIAADRADPGYPKRVDEQTWPGLSVLFN
jgi:hypothetical protein